MTRTPVSSVFLSSFFLALAACGLGGAEFHTGSGGRGGGGAVAGGGALPGSLSAGGTAEAVGSGGFAATGTGGNGGGVAEPSTGSAASGGADGLGGAGGAAGGNSGSGASSSAGATGGGGAGGSSSTSAGGAAPPVSTAASGGSGGSGGSGAPTDPSREGCSDRSREYFLDVARYPNVAGCAGGFSVPGVVSSESFLTPCLRQSGNDSENRQGEGCSVEDLCAEGWHVCRTRFEVSLGSPEGCIGDELTGQHFWLTRQSQDDAGRCSASEQAQNNIVGCGSMGYRPAGSDFCQPLDTYLSYSLCEGAWRCGQDQANGSQPVLNEGAIVTKVSDEGGGVLCCKGP